MHHPQRPARQNLKLWVSVATLLSLSIQSCQVLSRNQRTADLKPLLAELQAEDWRAADAETLQVLLQISDRKTEGWLTQTDVATLDCNVLVQLDQAWLEQSQGQFGFSPQHRIWQSVGGTVGEYTPQIAEQFGDRVGWRNQDQWEQYDTLNFSLQAPQGHLPATTGNGVSGSIWGGVATLSQRLQYCRHEVAIAQARADYYADCDWLSREQYCRLKRAAEAWGETPDWDGTGIPNLLDQLEQALAQQQWIAADEITAVLFDRYRRANFAEFEGSASHELIPCYLLQPVDELWTDYSQGQFGLSAQDQVLEALKDERPNRTNPSASELSQALGWSDPQFAPPQGETYNLDLDGTAPQNVPKGYYP
ncbi:MAG: GUN4 domain-containing protein, partial [Cyanobacteria bacterium P01_H01_bin.121]